MKIVITLFLLYVLILESFQGHAEVMPPVKNRLLLNKGSEVTTNNGDDNSDGGSHHYFPEGKEYNRTKRNWL